MFSSSVQNPKHLRFQRCWAKDGLNVAQLRDDRGGAEFGSSRTGWTWTGNWRQKRVKMWLHWRLLEANWCFSDCVWHQNFYTKCVQVEGPLAERTLRSRFIILQLLSTEFWSFKPTLSRTGEVCSDKFRPGCWQNATCVPGYFRKKNNTWN